MSNTLESTYFPKTPATFSEFVAGCARLFKNRTAIVEHHVEDRRSLSYRQLTEETLRLSSHLLRAGIKKSDRIAILSENRLEWVLLALAVLNIGAVLVPLDTNLTTDELSNLMKRAKIKLLGSSQNCLTAAITSRHQYDESLPILCFDPIRPGDHLISWSDFQEPALPVERSEVPILADDTALIVFTSGTTAQPKAVVLSHRNVLSSAWWTFQHTGVLNPESRVFFAIPLFHMFTFTVALLSPFMTGGAAILGSSLKPVQFQAELQASKATLLIAVPLIYDSIHQSVKAKLKEKPLVVRLLLKLHSTLTVLSGPRAWKRVSRQLYSPVHDRFGGHLKFLVSGGAPLKPEVAKGLEKLGFYVLQGYGMTEAGPVIASESSFFSKLGSVGRVLSHLQVRIADPDKNGIGEIQVKGEGIMQGYEKDGALNRDSFEEGWLKTGDLGYLDRDGFLFIRGRIKDLIVTPAGKKIYPEDLERFYLQSSWIKEICIQDMTGPNGYECLMATIVANPDASPDALTEEQLTKIIDRELQMFGKKLPLYKRINHFILSKEELSKTTLKKLKRHEIRKHDASQARNNGRDPNGTNHGNHLLGERVLSRQNHRQGIK